MLGMATLGFAVNFWAWALLSPLGPLFREQGTLGTLSESDVALLVAVPVLVGSLGRIVVGALTDRFGGRVMFPLVSAATMKEPLIDLKVLRRRPVILTATAAGFIYGVSGLYTMLLPMMVMTPAIMGLGYGFGVDAEGFAVFQAPIGAMTVVGGLIVGVLTPVTLGARIWKVSPNGSGTVDTRFPLNEYELYDCGAMLP